MVTWRKLLDEMFTINGETWGDVVSCTLSEKDLDVEFDDGYGSMEGLPFTVWTKTRVYFPVVYDGAEWVSWVSRDPDNTPTFHIGGC